MKLLILLSLLITNSAFAERFTEKEIRDNFLDILIHDELKSTTCDLQEFEVDEASIEIRDTHHPVDYIYEFFERFDGEDELDASTITMDLIKDGDIFKYKGVLVIKAKGLQSDNNYKFSYFIRDDKLTKSLTGEDVDFSCIIIDSNLRLNVNL